MSLQWVDAPGQTENGGLQAMNAEEGQVGETGQARPTINETEFARIRALVNARPWYHTMELVPGLSTPGIYDPSQHLEEMGFPKNLRGKTVLDIGTYDGFFSFEAER